MSGSFQIRYARAARVSHQTTAFLVLTTFIYGPGGTEQRVYATAGDFERQLHETFGMCVFAITLSRLVWRSMDTRPGTEALPAWMRAASKTTRVALFAWLFAVPLSAITGAWLEERLALCLA